MIPINDYRQFIAELVNTASTAAGLGTVPAIKLAVTESQLVNLLKDQAGIVVAGNIPGCEISNGVGWLQSHDECLLAVLEKMPRDYQGKEEEFSRYARLQQLMMEIVRLLTNADGFDRFCDKGEMDYSQGLNVEWEYNEYGGFNGLSVTFRLKDGKL